MVNTVRWGRFKVAYSVHAPKRIKGNHLHLPNFRQRDVHSCGFVAALTVVRHFGIDVSDKDVLRAVRPSVNWGINRTGMRQALAQLGIEVEHRRNLTVKDLKEFVRQGAPVIISVWPDGWLNDHWTVVQGFVDDRVHLTNHRSLPIEAFRLEWSDMDMRNGRGGSGEGLVCPPGW